MDRRRVAIAVACCLVVLVGIVGIRAVGIQPFADDPHEVDLEAEPATLAYDAAAALHDADYEMTFEAGIENATTGDVQSIASGRAAVSNADRRALAHQTELGKYDRSQITYVNHGVEWRRFDDRDWNIRSAAGWDDGQVNPLTNLERLAAANATLADDGDSLVVTVHDRETAEAVAGAAADDADPTLELRVDESNERLEALVYRVERDESTFEQRFGFEYGDVTVDRPDDIPFDLEEWLVRVYHG